MGLFGTAHGWGGGKKPPPSLKSCHTYPTMIKLCTVIPYLKKIQKICESCDTHFISANISIFPGNHQTLRYQEIQV